MTRPRPTLNLGIPTLNLGAAGAIEAPPDLGLGVGRRAPPVDPVEATERELSAFQQREVAERDRMELATDSEFWCAVVFESRAQKEAFLRALLGSLDLGDKYLLGREVAARLGIKLPAVALPSGKGRRNKGLDDLT